MNTEYFQYDNQTRNIHTLSNSEKNELLSLIKNQTASLIEDISNPIFSQPLNPIKKLLLKRSSSKKVDKVKYIKSLITVLNSELSTSNKKIPNFNYSSDRIVLLLTYNNLFAIVNIILIILDQVIRKNTAEKHIETFLGGNLPERLTDCNLSNGVKLFDMIGEFQTIKKINFRLFDKNDIVDDVYDNNFIIHLKAVKLFCLFFQCFFPNALELNLDLNVFPLNHFYVNNKDPYQVNEAFIIQRGMFYKDIFITNCEILDCFLKLNAMTVNITLYDSYQLELPLIFNTELKIPSSKHNAKLSDTSLNTSVSGAEMLNKTQINTSTINDDSSLISKSTANKTNQTPSSNRDIQSLFANKVHFFNKIFMKLKDRSFLDMKFEINAIDPLLFHSSNQLIFANDFLANLHIKLFPLSKSVELRKIHINQYYYNYYLSNGEKSLTHKYPLNDKFIQLEKVKTIITDQDLLLLHNEIIIDELFEPFNSNLLDLIIILSEKFEKLSSLKIDLTESADSSLQLGFYDNYGAAMVLFVFNLFMLISSKQQECKLNSLQIALSDLNYSNIHLFTMMKQKYNNLIDGFLLNDTLISDLRLNITNISYLIKFENYPSKLLKLELKLLSQEDINELLRCVEQKKNCFQELIEIEMSFDFDVDFNTEFFKKLTNLEILPKIEKIIIEPNREYDDFNDLIEMFYVMQYSKVKEKNMKYVFKINNKLINEDQITVKNNLSKAIESYGKLKYNNFNSNKDKIVSFDIKKCDNDETNKLLLITYCIESLLGKSTNKIENKPIYEKTLSFVRKPISKSQVFIEFI